MRVRPLTSLEKSHNAFVTVEAIDEAHVLVNDPDDKMGGIDYLRLDKTKAKHYRLDSVFGPESTQAAVYATARPLEGGRGLQRVLLRVRRDRRRQTFTMTGTLDDPGVIPLTLDDLVLVAAEQKEEYDVKISMQTSRSTAKPRTCSTRRTPSSTSARCRRRAPTSPAPPTRRSPRAPR